MQTLAPQPARPQIFSFRKRLIGRCPTTAGEPTKAKSMKCSHVVRDVPIEAYRLPSDGKKWKHECGLRRSLVTQLSTYADGNGTKITPSVKTLAAGMGYHRATIHRLLDDLKTLGFLKDGAIGKLRTRERVLDLDSMRSRITSCVADTKVGADLVAPKDEPANDEPELCVADRIPCVADRKLRVAVSNLRVADTYQTQPCSDRLLTENPDRESKHGSDLQKAQIGAISTEPIPIEKGSARPVHSPEFWDAAVKIAQSEYGMLSPGTPRSNGLFATVLDRCHGDLERLRDALDQGATRCNAGGTEKLDRNLLHCALWWIDYEGGFTPERTPIVGEVLGKVVGDVSQRDTWLFPIEEAQPKPPEFEAVPVREAGKYEFEECRDHAGNFAVKKVWKPSLQPERTLSHGQQSEATTAEFIPATIRVAKTFGGTAAETRTDDANNRRSAEPTTHRLDGDETP